MNVMDCSGECWLSHRFLAAVASISLPMALLIAIVPLPHMLVWFQHYTLTGAGFIQEVCVVNKAKCTSDGLRQVASCGPTVISSALCSARLSLILLMIWLSLSRAVHTSDPRFFCVLYNKKLLLCTMHTLQECVAASPAAQSCAS